MDKESDNKPKKENARPKPRRIVIGQSRFNLAAGSSQAVRVKLSLAGIERVRLAGKRAIPITIGATGLQRRTMHLKLH